MSVKPCERPGDKRGDGRCRLVLVQLDVRQPRVVIDDRVSEVVADVLGHPGAGRAASQEPGDLKVRA